MIATDNDLGHLRSRSELMLSCVRLALRNAIAWRRAGGPAPTQADFTTLARTLLQQSHDFLAARAPNRRRMTSQVEATARRVFASRLTKRLLTMAPRQYIASAGQGPDALLRDRNGRIHAVLFSSETAPLNMRLAAAAVARRVSLENLSFGVTVHVLPIDTGKHHTFLYEDDLHELPAAV
jgi:hypothetical protein